MKELRMEEAKGWLSDAKKRFSSIWFWFTILSMVASSNSKTSGSSKTAKSSIVKKTTNTAPQQKPKNVDKVDFGKPKPPIDTGG